ncbi:LuxR C-terminal-related transcriptional regulator [Kitasatospora sp. NPDC054939]
MLKLLGVGEDAEFVYQEMLREPNVGVGDIALRLGWDEARVRSGMDELAKLSLVRPSWESEGFLRAVEPQVGLASLLYMREAELQRRQRDLEISRLAIENVIADYSSIVRSRGNPTVEQLDGIDSVRLRIESLAHACQKEVVGFVPSGAQSAASMEASKPLDLAVLERGVQMRSIYLQSISNDSATMDYARWLIRAGAQVRLAPTLPPRMVIYDSRTAIVPVDPADTSRGAMLLEGPGVVTALGELFERYWSSAIPVDLEPDAAEAEGEEELTSQERAILELLAQGCTDDVVAKRLGVSVRTGRRITASVAGKLKAKSRFQMGAKAALRGWVDPDAVN